MLRSIAPELLDTLPPSDAGARKARRDLQKLNAIMGHSAFFLRWLLRERDTFSRLVELGAGDGHFALKLARLLAPHIGPRHIVLVDRIELVDDETRRSFHKLGWKLEVVVADVFEWLGRAESEPNTAMLANLFLHHFTETQLRELLQRAAQQSVLFSACEPRRSRWALAACELLPLLGCSSVTRHDAPISVWAGFTDSELSSLWPQSEQWGLLEKNIGFFSHAFLARRGGG